MVCDVVGKYHNAVLKPKLVALDILPEMIERVVFTSSELMKSCISHWTDASFRKTVLVVGEEEGTYYSPKASIDVRKFVVVTLRNSALESVHADSLKPANKRLSRSDINEITSAAIEYFKNLDFDNVSNKLGTLENDIYGRLSKKYLVAWTALTELSKTPRQVSKYNPVPITVNPTLDNLKLQHAVKGYFLGKDQSQMTNVVSDGYSLTIDHGLQQTLKM